MTDWLTRTEIILGSDGLKKLKESNVLVVGLGGVGAYAAEMICRAGVGSMTIVDGDAVHPTNRNRQLPALKSTEGLPKADVMGQRLKDINPEVNLTIIQEYLKDDRMIEVLDMGFDYVVDAIDTLSPKIFLILHTLNKKMPLVSSMGAGGKYDPTRIAISDISETTDCSLARILRKRLHRLGIRDGFTAVYSTEPIDKKKVVPTPGELNKASVVGTISYMPASFGIACASVVIRDLTGITRIS
ncbi:MAG: tRNA threonylcarbamoyladenosine dehydratase [Bacteroidales bacterium]|nr:tRNA threonylcarbamoyladenosine dehydratase [Bacteroidales bacterium]MBK7626839.1 tRNA threonylcarbamoyladenosine dehydratase [Bacteroidales bacterium]